MSQGETMRTGKAGRLWQRVALACLLVAGAISWGLFAPQADGAEAPPNVLLIMTDDQGYGDLSLHGNPHLHTPHTDRLGEQGVRFERFYVNSFCAPTRAALLTGRWPLRTGCHGVTHNREAMRPDEVTIAEALRAVGYRTSCIGKWHNGEQFPYTPPGQGFDEFLGFNNGHINNYFNATLLRGIEPVETTGYITDVLTDEAIRFISAEKDKPFFCYLSYNAPHSPFQVPDNYYDKFRDQGLDEKVSAFYGMCENLDDNLGRLLDRLVANGQRENTIVLFLTDNGGTAGVRLFNAGMRGGKTSLHEGGTRVPLFIHWPAANWTPHVVQPLTSHIDLFPTLLDLCGVALPPGPPLDGRSLRPLLEQTEATDWPERILFTHNPISETNRYPGAVRTERYRLVREIPRPLGGSSAVDKDDQAEPWQLFDMRADPGEKQNLAKKHPEIVQQLSALYEEWMDDISQAGLRRFPLPIGFDEENPVDLKAPQAYFDAPLKFASGPGFANDWLTNWTKTEARIWFEVDVQVSGEYELELAYACPADSAGSILRISCDDAYTQTTVPAGEAAEIPLPHRDDANRYRNRDWATLPVGRLHLEAGEKRLVLQAISQPGEQVLDFKHLRLRRLAD